MTSVPDASTTLRLTTSTGPPVELAFVEEGVELFLVASDPTATWARDSTRSTVEVSLPDGRTQLRLGELVTDPSKAEEVLSSFRRKYGDSPWERYYRGRTRILVLREVRGREVRPIEEVLKAEFDAVALGYTTAVEQNPFSRYLRSRSASQFLPLFRDRDPILELGPGTGVETLALLRAGHRVLAVDISPRMLDELHRRAESVGLSANLETRLGAIGNLESVLQDVPSRSIRGAVSTFGALNLDPHIERLPTVLARLLAPGAPFFAGVLNRLGFTTAAYLLLAGHPRPAVQRLRNPIVAGGLLYPLEVRPFTARQFTGLFGPDFWLEGLQAASVLVPPYWSAPLHRFWGESGRRSLARLDERLSRLFPLDSLGEYQFV
ncbi:MAG TPA: class I SAM-dependent methyltransferase, partial [Thermoplasmata archaeon]|nr:class I SAM-dependent methyltransferase [Thermoplasmata archaeon]